MSSVETDQDEQQEQQQVTRGAAKKLARQVDANDIKWQMSTKQGRRVMWRLLEKCGVYRSSFTGNSETFFREGERNVGLFLVAEIHAHAPEGYALMVTESKAPK